MSERVERPDLDAMRRLPETALACADVADGLLATVAYATVLERALKRYGQHDWMCGYHTAATHGDPNPVCSCGLGALLAAPPAAEREGGGTE